MLKWPSAASERLPSSLRSLEIDILVDLLGYTGGNRTEIFAHRPAPIQVSYTGLSRHHGRELF